MTGPEFDELLSAYLDGEATAEERAFVEQKLERTPALRDVLDEFADVGEAVRALPRPPAPADLSARVAKSIRALAPLPKASQPVVAPTSAGQSVAAPTATQSSAQVRRWTRRHWTMGSVAAACCLVAVVLLNRKTADAPRGAVELAVDTRSPSRTPSVDFDVASTMSAAPAAPPSPSPAPIFSTPATALEIDPSRESELLRDLVVNGGQRPEPGTVFRMLYDNAAEVRVLEYVVTDVDDSAGQLRMLLARNGIQPLGPETSDSVVVTTPFSKAGSGIVNPRLVYFEGGETQVEDTVKRFEESPSILIVNDYGSLADAADPDPVDAAKPQIAAAGTSSESAEKRREEGGRQANAGSGDAATLASRGKNDAPNNRSRSLEANRELDSTPDELSLAVKAAELASEEALMGENDPLDQKALQQVTLGNGVAFDLPEQAAPPMLNYVLNYRVPVAQFSQSQKRNASGQRFQSQAYNSQARDPEQRTAGVSRVLVIMQAPPQPAAEAAPAPAEPPAP